MNKIVEALATCCNMLNLDVKSLPEEVFKAMEDTMKLQKESKVRSVHPYTLPSPESYEKGRQKTYIKSEESKYHRKAFWAKSHDEMISKLFSYYFPEDYTFEGVFYQMCDYEEENYMVRKKTIVEYKKDYNRFFKGESIASTEITNISINQMATFLSAAHLKASDKDKENGYSYIEKHRHKSIQGIINKVYGFANQFLGLNCKNPLTTGSINYKAYPHYDTEKLDKEGYSYDDIKKLLVYFDSIEKPSIPELAVGAIFETLARNGEIRALRFKDFHLDSEQPYVRICGMANGSKRENRVKKDSSKGMRNILISPRLKRIYDIGKKISWSNEYIFPKNKNYVTDEDIRTGNICVSMQSIQRALMSMCKKAGVPYYPPHQIRFYGAMDMINKNNDIYATANLLGHSTIEMTKKYSDKLNNRRVYVGPNLA